MKNINYLTLKSSTVIQPSYRQLSRISWSILWRYGAFVLFFIAFFALGYHLGISQVVEFYNFILYIQRSTSFLDYTKLFSLYSRSILYISLLRTIIGFIVTYVIFLYVSQLQFKGFALSLNVAPSKTYLSQKGILIISWAFYWRTLSLMAVFFLIPLLNMRVAGMNNHVGYTIAGSVILFFILMLFVLKKIINKPFDGFMLFTSRN
jgi:hypothetical protein